MATIKQRVNEIYQKVDSIAKKGKDNYLEYEIYLNELVSQGDWELFDDMMIKKYQIDIRQYTSVDQVKKKTFEKIRFQTLDPFQTDLRDLYKTYGVYQNIYDILLSDGNFIEIAPGNIIANQKYLLIYDGDKFELIGGSEKIDNYISQKDLNNVKYVNAGGFNNYISLYNTDISDYSDYKFYILTCSKTNTNSATLRINSLDTKPIKKNILGQIREIEKSQTINSRTYITYDLEVTKNGNSYIIDDEVELIEKYRIAIVDLLAMT